ncbi:MAG: aldose 1-epimerase family protein [Clostridia bacterium]|nr:aldose 1-epimerase family protein [Clostridia bacterium]
MKDLKYMGRSEQVFGVDELRLVGGKGDGLRMLNVRNAAGLEFYVSLDRCADIPRLSVSGVNCGYFSPSGFVAPAFYDKNDFLRSFTAGFFTTCGLDNVGVPNVDEGEEVPTHGTIANKPCEHSAYWIENDEIHVKATVREAVLFGRKLLLEREYIVPLYENVIRLTDRITNIGSEPAPIEVLYHCNMGYPLLSEKAVVDIPSVSCVPRTPHAAEGFDDRLTMEKPQRGYEEMCFFHTFSGKAQASIYNPDVKTGVAISFDTAELPFFTEWKMMGEYDYVLGLEPGNCDPDGRAHMRERGLLEILQPDEVKVHHVTFTFTKE